MTPKHLIFGKCILLSVFLLTIICCNDDDSNPESDLIATAFEGCCPSNVEDLYVDTFGIYIPNAFSPNQDGINDIFLVYGGPGIVQINSLVVYNREGVVLFERSNFFPNDPTHGWDGTDLDGNLSYGRHTYEVTVSAITSSATFEGVVCHIDCYHEAIDFLTCRWGTQHNGVGEIDVTLPSQEFFDPEDENDCYE